MNKKNIKTKQIHVSFIFKCITRLFFFNSFIIFFLSKSQSSFTTESIQFTLLVVCFLFYIIYMVLFSTELQFSYSSVLSIRKVTYKADTYIEPVNKKKHGKEEKDKKMMSFSQFASHVFQRELRTKQNKNQSEE